MSKIFTELNESQLRVLLKEGMSDFKKDLLSSLDEQDDLLNTSEACKLLGVGRTTLHNYVKQGIVVKYKPCGRVYYSRKQIESAIKTGKGGQNV